MKGVGMPVVSRRGVNFGFWYHLGVLGKTPLFLAVKVSFRVARKVILKICICLCFKMVSFWGQKELGPRPD